MLLLPAVFLLLLAPAAAAIAATATQDLVPFTNVTSINVCTREHTPCERLRQGNEQRPGTMCGHAPPLMLVVCRFHCSCRLRRAQHSCRVHWGALGGWEQAAAKVQRPLAVSRLFSRAGRRHRWRHGLRPLTATFLCSTTLPCLMKCGPR